MHAATAWLAAGCLLAAQGIGSAENSAEDAAEDVARYVAEAETQARGPRAAAEFAAEQIRGAAEQALTAAGDAQTAAWDSAARAQEQFHARQPDNPWRLLVDLQAAIAAVERGVQERDRNRALGRDPTPARESLRQAIADLEAVAATTAALLADRYDRLGDGARRPSADEAPPNRSELEALLRRVKRLTADARREQALAYPPASADRDHALQLAQELLDELSRSTADPALAAAARLALVECLRLGQRWAEADQALADLEQDHRDGKLPVGPWPQRCLAERLRGLIAREEYTAAWRLLEPLLDDVAAERPPELDYALLETALALEAARRGRAEQPSPTAAGPQAQIPPLVARAEALAERIGVRHAAPWPRRAAALLAWIQPTSPPSDDPVWEVRSAVQLRDAGRFAEAAAAFAAAADKLFATGAEEAGRQARLAAAAALQSAGQLEAAEATLVQLAEECSSSPQAPEALLQAAAVASLAARDGQSAERIAALRRYEALLGDLVVRWPDSVAAGTARLWRGRLLAAREAWEAARVELRVIAPDHPAYPAAVAELAATYRRQLDRRGQRASEETTDEEPAKQPDVARQTLAAAVGELQALITGPRNRWPDVWTPAQAVAAEQLAALQLRHAPDGADYAWSLLQGLARGPLAAPLDAERERSLALLAGAAAQCRKSADASWAAWEQLGPWTPAEMAELLRNLPPLSPWEAPRNPRTAELVVRLTAAAPAPTADDAVWLREVHAARLAALVHAGQPAAAVALARQLVAAEAEAPAAQERLARLLAASPNDAELGEALGLYGLLEQSSRPGRPAWRRAREARIELLDRLGEQGQAQKLRALTAALYPQAGVLVP